MSARHSEAYTCGRVLGISIFLVLMWIVFRMTVDASGPYLDWVDGLSGGPITNWVLAILELVGLTGAWFESLLVDGVGGVLVFVPVLLYLYLYLFLALLEDSGYMAPAASVMD